MKQDEHDTGYTMWVNLPQWIEQDYEFELMSYDEGNEDETGQKFSTKDPEEFIAKLEAFQWPSVKKFTFIFTDQAVSKDSFLEKLRNLMEWSYESLEECITENL